MAVVSELKEGNGKEVELRGGFGSGVSNLLVSLATLEEEELSWATRETHCDT